MSSLQKQLAVIQAKSTNELDLKAQKAAHSRSLLFDPSIAATQSMDVIYQLCYEGFEELCALDQRFVRFERSIFGPHSKKEDRVLMTANENKELDAVLEGFLGLVGARLLLKPAIKAVEWLVRRFRIQEYNVEYLILTFLPYHATPIFSTLLSILPKQLPATFKFLHPYMTKFTNPPRGVLVFSAMRNPPFFSALNRYVLDVCHAQYTYHILLSFWASIVAQTMNDMLESSVSGRQNIQRQREEDLLTRILPILNEALSMKKVPELILGCYMLVAVLVSKAPLDERTLDALMTATVQSMTEETCDAGLGCAAIIAEQRQAVKLPRSVLRGILKFEHVTERLSELAKQQPTQKLTIGIALGVLMRMSKGELPQGMELLHFLIESPTLADSQKTLLLQQIREVVNMPDSEPIHMQDLSELLHSHEKQESVQDTLTGDQMDIDEPSASANQEIDMNGFADESEGIPSAAMEPSNGSFLASSDVPFLAELVRAFERSVRNEKKMQDFLCLPFLHDSIASITFLIRVFCTSSSIAARCAALRNVSERLISGEVDSSYVQATLPYTLLALSDSSPKVRRRATELVIELHKVSSKTNHKVAATERPLLYGTSTDVVKWLSPKTVEAFMASCLVPGLEECSSDPDQITRLIQSALDRHGAGLKTAQRTEVFAFLCSHTHLSSLFAAKLAFLTMLNTVDKISGQTRSHFLQSTMRDLVSMDMTKVQSICTREHIDLGALNVQTVAIVHPEDQEAVAYLLLLIQGTDIDDRTDIQTAAFARVRNIWSQLTKSKRKSFAEILLSASVTDDINSKSALCQEESLSTLKAVNIPADVLLALLENTTSTISHQDQSSAPKRRRTNGGDRSDVSAAQAAQNKTALARLTLVLELVDASKPEAHLELFHALFKVLQVMHDYRVQTASDLGYLQDLTLSSLSATLKELDRASPSLKLNASLIRVDLLVDCVRTTASMQSRNLALLLLSELTKHTPQAVLHSIMPIFTLMSGTTVRQSDENSAHVVDQTIQQVVPLLAQTLRDQRKDLVQSTAEILLSFAAAFEHIAPHRRLRLYSLLASSLGASESLYAIIATLVDRFPANNDIDRFVASLFGEFQSAQALATIQKYLDLALDCLQQKPTLARVLLKEDEGAKQQVSAAARLLAVSPVLLRDPSFRAKLAHDLSHGTDVEALRNTFGTALQQTLKLSQAITNLPSLGAPCARILESLLGLFPFDQLTKSIEDLLDTTDQDTSRSILKTLHMRIRTTKHVDGPTREAIIHLLPRLAVILQDPAQTSLKPSALACVDQICEKFGKTDHDATLAAAEVIASDHCVGSSDSVLAVLSLHCLASSVDILQNDFIPLLQTSMQAATSCLRASMLPAQKDEKLHNAAYAFFTALADKVPFMISKAYLRTLLELSHASSLAGFKGDGDENRSQFLRLVAVRLDMGIVLDVLGEVWPNAVRQGAPALEQHIGLLKASIEHQSKATIARNVRKMFSVLLEVLDLRRSCANAKVDRPYDAQQLGSAEQSVIATLISLVLKINDAMFRPFFVQLLEWSSSALPKKDTAGIASRSMTLFNLVGALSERLKSIFTVYFGYLTPRATEILQGSSSKSDPTYSQDLKLAVVNALHSSFKHDQDDFWQSPNHFTPVLPALVSLLSTIPAPHTTASIIPAITALATAASSHEHHQTLNRKLLELLRADTARVRLAAVRCQMSLAEKLGDEWLSHLPEMLPVIGELQDDDDELVERETGRWIKLVEGILGESLESMLQ